MAYELQGRMAEVCTCNTFCPCVAGLEPDGGECRFNWVFHFDSGAIDGVDVGGLNMGFIGHLVGSAVEGKARLVMLVDDDSTDEQEKALLAAFGGQLGGPLGDLAGLVGELVSVERVPIEFDVSQGTGVFGAGERFKAEIQALTGPSGKPTTMENFALSGVLGAKAYASAPTSHDLKAAGDGIEFSANTATQFEFHYVG